MPAQTWTHAHPTVPGDVCALKDQLAASSPFVHAAVVNAAASPSHAAHPIAGLPNPTTLIVLLGSLSAFELLSLDTYLPALRDFNTSTALAQLTLSACVLGLATGQIVAGSISEKLATACHCWSGSGCMRSPRSCARSRHRSGC